MLYKMPRDDISLLSKELEYNRILNTQNIFMVFFGVIALAIFSLEFIPQIVKVVLMANMSLGILILIILSRHKLKNIENNIK